MSIKVIFPNGKRGAYPCSDAILLYRPAWGRENPFRIKTNVHVVKKRS